MICDLAPRINGYWGDSCSSFTVGGGGSPAYQKMFDTAKLTLDLAISEIRPGLKVSELDRTLRDFMQKSGFSYPHHSGHGIGTSVHEYPRLVPDEHALLEENMIIMVEPGTYIDGIGGVRTEHMIRVSRTGCEVLTDFEMKAQLG